MAENRVHLSAVGNNGHPLTACGRFWKVEQLRMAAKPEEVTCRKCAARMQRVTGRNHTRS